MQSLLRAPRAPLILSSVSIAGVLVFALAVGVLMQPAASIVGPERLSDLVCFQLAFTGERALELLLSFPEDARAAIPQVLIPGDFALAWGYGLVLFGLTGLLAMRLPGKWLRAGAILIWAPIVASVFDCIENLFLYAIAAQVAADPTAPVRAILPVLAGAASTIKWVALCIVTPAYGFAGSLRGITLDRRATSWVVYALLFITLLSMVAKPLQDIPKCF